MMKREREEDELQSEQKRRNERRGGEPSQLQQPAGAAAGAAVSADENHTFTTGELALDHDPPISSSGSLLPRDLLPHVFSLLDLSDRCRARRVCRAWRAAALEPPHSTTLTLALPCRGVPNDRPAAGADEAPAAEDPAALAEAAFGDSLSKALQLASSSPLAAELKRASFTLAGQPASPPALRAGSWHRRWPLADALWALRTTSVTSLQLSLAPLDILRAPEKDWLHAALRIIRTDTLPALLELDIDKQLTKLLLWNREGKPVERVVHATLQRLNAGTALEPHDFITQLPSLTRLESLLLGPSGTLYHVRQLADRGLKVRSLRVGDVTLPPPNLAEDIYSIFRPAEFDWSLPGPSKLRANAMAFEAGLPAGFGAGVQQVRLGTLRPHLLRWLAEIASNTALRKLIFARGIPRSLDTVPPVRLFQALQGCHDGLEVVIRWPVDSKDWDMPALDAAVRFLLSNRRLLVAVRFGLGDFLAAVERSEFGGGVVKQEGSGRVPTGPLTIAATLLAAEYHVTRCEEITKRRSLLVHELWELSRVRTSLERLPRDSASHLLGRCRALGDGRWPQWPPQKPLPAITRVYSLCLDAHSQWDRAALPVLAAKGFQAHHLYLTGYDLTDPTVASAAKAIVDPTAVPYQSPVTLGLESCLVPPAVDGFGLGAQKIVLHPTAPEALPWLAEVSRSPALLQLLPSIRPAINRGCVRHSAPLPAVLEALRGCREGLEVVIQWPKDGDAANNHLKNGVALLIADPTLLEAVHFDLSAIPNRVLVQRAEQTIVAAEWIAARCGAAAGRRALLDWELREMTRLGAALEAVCQDGKGKEYRRALLERAGRALERCRALLGAHAAAPPAAASGSTAADGAS